MIAERDHERRFAIAAAILLPWLMLLVTDWTVTPIGMVDGWIYRALGRDLINANASSLSEYYYAARPFVLVPRYLLTRVFLEGPAHFVYGLLCAHVLLFAVLDFLTSVARPGTRFAGVLLFGTCVYLLRSLGWGYVDGSLITWFMVGLAGMARWFRPDASTQSRRLAALVAGACFAAMLTTHPMSAAMLATPLGFAVWQSRQPGQSRWWRLWGQMIVGGVSAVLLMGVVCQLLYGRFFFFLPIIQAALTPSTSLWKKPLSVWLPDANQLVLIFFAWVGAALFLALAKWRRVELTAFERFAWINLVSLMTVVVGLELFTSGYWLEYVWFASYFLPSALLALAAVLGERNDSPPTGPMMAGLGAVVVGGVAFAFRLEAPFFLPPFAARFFPFRMPVQWMDAVPLASLQVGIALIALVAIAVLRLRSRQRGMAVLMMGGLMALVAGGPINQVTPGDAVEAQAAAAVSEAIVVIQDELRGRRPAYWYDAQNPLARLFVTISSGHLAFYSQLREAYPEGPRALRPHADGTTSFFEAGDPVVILDDATERFPRAQRSFSEIGISLEETRRARLQVADKTYWLIFASLEPKRLVLEATELPTTLQSAVTSPHERVSERERGYLSYGPYVHLGPGRHRVTYHLRLLDHEGSESVGGVDVVGLDGKVIRTFAVAALVRSAALENGDLAATLDFTLERAVPGAEFRVFSEGNARLALRSIEVETPELKVAPPRLALLAASSSLSAGGSETLKSTDVRTSGLFADLQADAAGSGRVSVKASIRLGENSTASVGLAPGDVLTTTVGAVSLAMTPRSVLGFTWYEAEFDGDHEGTEVKVALSRQADSSALGSRAVLPAPLVITGPTAGATLSRTSGLTVSWTGTGPGFLHLAARGSCIHSVEEDLPSDQESLDLAAFRPLSGSEQDPCPVTISLVRSLEGTVDPAWGKGGTFEATVSRSVSIISTR